jgi:hypothetical protein
MENKDLSNVLIYRVREQGLEVFMVKDANGNDSLPQTGVKTVAFAALMPNSDSVMELDTTHTGQSNFAVEADWHEIPSLKSLIAADVSLVKATIKEMVPNMMEKGAYFAVREAFKKVLPEQYTALKELKDIVMERNSTRF